MSVSYGGDSITFADGSVNSSGFIGHRNRIINGAMVLDQRNAGASVTNVAASGTYALDRWRYYGTSASKFTVQQNAGSVTPPNGYTNYLGITSLSANTPAATDEYIVQQFIEGYNIADLGWGAAGASSVTLSFWVRSSLTGTFGGVVKNNAGDRSYPFSYTINSANTWEYETITIPGDTSGTWLTTNGRGLTMIFNLGTGSTYLQTANAWTASFANGATGNVNILGTNGATFYITGVQLERGSTASSFEYRSYGAELALCQRYYEKSYDIDTVPGTSVSDNKGVVMFRGSGVNSRDYVPIYFKQTKRDAPTVTIFSSTGASGFYRDVETPTNLAAQVNGSGTSLTVMQSNSTATTNKQCSFLWTASSEL